MRGARNRGFCCRTGAGWTRVGSFSDYDEGFFAAGGLGCLGRVGGGRLSRGAEVDPMVRLGPPVNRPSKLVCVGKNYLEHAKELGEGIPTEPTLFMKATSAWSGPSDDVIIPRGSTKLDYEVELAVVIGRLAAYVDEHEALDCVAGYATFCDFSERAFQKEMGGQWTKGKSADRFAPMGPWLVTADEIADPQMLRLWCKVNGELRQNSWTGDMMFSVRQLVAYISRFMTLLPGDVVATGTPGGVAHGHVPAAIPAGGGFRGMRGRGARGIGTTGGGIQRPMSKKRSRTRIAMLPWPMPPGGPRFSACPFCDTLHTATPVPEGTAARCARCGALLYQNRPASLARASAFSLAALVLMVVAHQFPFLTMDAASLRRNLTLINAARAMVEEGSPVLGCAIALFTIIAPLVLAGGLIYVCGPLLFGRIAPGATRVAKWMHRSEPWNMVEVFLLGVLVSLLKLAKMADIYFGIGFWAFAGVMLCMAAAVAGIDRDELWDRMEVAKS